MGDWFDVNLCDPVLGVGRLLERIFAPSRDAAEQIAGERHGKHILVTLSGATPRERVRKARDLGRTRIAPRNS